MNIPFFKWPRSSRISIFVSILLPFLLITNVGHAYANTVTINDNASVLNSEDVRTEAEKLPDPILIYTTNTFHGDQTALDKDAISRIPDDQSLVIETNTADEHLSIQSRDKANLTNEDADNAVAAFTNTFNQNIYTDATDAAIDTLVKDPPQAGFRFSPVQIILVSLLSLVAIGLIIFIIISFIRKQNTGKPPMGSQPHMDYPGNYDPYSVNNYPHDYTNMHN